MTIPCEPQTTHTPLQAKVEYMEAIGLFLKAAKAEPDRARSKMLQNKATEFLLRAEDLAAELKEREKEEKDGPDPLLADARRLRDEGLAEEKAGAYTNAKAAFTKSIERYLRLLKVRANRHATIYANLESGPPPHPSVRSNTRLTLSAARRVKRDAAERERGPPDGGHRRHATRREGGRAGAPAAGEPASVGGHGHGHGHFAHHSRRSAPRCHPIHHHCSHQLPRQQLDNFRAPLDRAARLETEGLEADGRGER